MATVGGRRKSHRYTLRQAVEAVLDSDSDLDTDFESESTGGSEAEAEDCIQRREFCSPSPPASPPDIDNGCGTDSVSHTVGDVPDMNGRVLRSRARPGFAVIGGHGDTAALTDSEADDEHDNGDEPVADAPAAAAQPRQYVHNWRPAQMQQPDIPQFTSLPGIQVNTAGFTELQYFKLFLTEDLLATIVQETNRYADQYIQEQNVRNRSRVHQWHPTTVEEMETFLGLLFLMGVVKKPSIELYWSLHPLFATPVFNAIMARNRFQLLLKFLHFTDKTAAPAADDPDRDRLYKIRPLIDHLFTRFQAVYTPAQQLSVDEELLLWKGRLLFRQYLPLKRARFGIKLYCLCETTGYTYRFRVYTGKQAPQEIDQVPQDAAALCKTEKIVVHLMEPLLNLGYQVFMDNFYSSVKLFTYLDQHNTGCCGTVRANRVPQVIKNKQVKKGESAAYRSHNLLCVKYKDKKDVYILSNMHRETSTRKRVRGRQEVYVEKPDCVLAYNSNMGGVDKLDQMIQPYNAARKTLKWYRKLAVHLLQVSLLNAHVLYKQDGGQLPFLKFQKEVFSGLIFQGTEHTGERQEDLVRLTERHFPEVNPQTTGSTKQSHKKHQTKRCRVCHRQGLRRETIYFCPSCPSQPGLCCGKCFKLYHSQLKYW